MREQIRKDLAYVFGHFPLESLVHLRRNLHRLIRGVYKQGGRGCLFYILSEPLEDQIDTKEKLTRFFTGGSGWPYREFPEYQPARYLVDLFDGRGNCRTNRYGKVRQLDMPTLTAVLDDTIRARQAARPQPAQVRADYGPLPDDPFADLPYDESALPEPPKAKPHLDLAKALSSTASKITLPEPELEEAIPF